METVFDPEPWALLELTEGATAGGSAVSGEKTSGLGGWRRGGRGSDMSDEGSHTPKQGEESEGRTEWRIRRSRR